MNIPSSVTAIDMYAFYDCIGLKTVTWNAKNCADFTSSVYAPFSTSKNINSFTFGDEVEKIPSFLCYGMSGLTDVNIPESVTTIGDQAFANCGGITELTWNAVECSTKGNMPTNNIEHVTIGNKVKTLPFGFLSGSKITVVTIPESIIKIGNNAFYGCSGLTSVTIPENVDSIGGQAFAGCSNITKLTWNAINCETNGGMTTNNIEDVTIGDKVKTLPSGFLNGSKIIAITIPESVIKIGNGAFYGCYNLTTVTIPASVTIIGTGAFYSCHNLTSVNIPTLVTVIEDRTFYDCSNMTSITIPQSVNQIGNYAFYGCHGLTNVVIPNSVTSIGEGAFCDCNSLAEVVVGKYVTQISDELFRNCSSLTNVNIPESVNHIGTRAFASCSALTNVTSPSRAFARSTRPS